MNQDIPYEKIMKFYSEDVSFFKMEFMENNTNTFQWVRKLYDEVKRTKYVRLGKFFSELTDGELDQLKQSCHFFFNGNDGVFSRSFGCFVYLVAMGESCPILTPNEFKEAAIAILLMAQAETMQRQGLGKAVYENFNATGLCSWNNLFIGKGKDYHDQPEEPAPTNPSAQQGNT